MKPDAMSSVIPSAIIVLALCTAAGADVIQVPADQPTIAAALTAAVAGDEVVVAAGTYAEHDLILPSGVVLRGATGNAADVIVDAQRGGRCIYGAGLDASTRIAALTLANGLSTAGTTPDRSWGGGLYVDEGELTVADCIFTANEAAIAGGAWIRGTGTPRVTGCVFDANSGTETCGLLLIGSCNPEVVGCEFRGGRLCMYGGAVSWAGYGVALFEDCLVEDNTTVESGGAIECLTSVSYAKLHGCTIRNNSTGIYGGGLVVASNAQVRLENCLVEGNSAGDYGGGLYVGTNCVVTAENTTILGNTAAQWADGRTGAGTTVNLICCTVDLDQWGIDGTLNVDDSGCAIPDERTSWGDIKAIFR